MTRRSLLALMSAGLPAAKAQTSKKLKSLPIPAGSEFVRLLDPVTENPLVRLTGLVSNNFLPAATNRSVSAKDHFLIFSSDRTGRSAPFQLNLRSGVVNPLSTSENVKPQSLCLDAAGHTLYWLDNTTLTEFGLSGKHTRVLAQNIAAFSLGPALTDLAAIQQNRLLRLNGGRVFTLAEGVGGWCAVRPNGDGVVFDKRNGEARELWYAPFGNGSSKAFRLTGGQIASPCWSPDGRSVLFLRESLLNGVIRSEIREVYPETCAEQLVAPTSQFAVFSPNADGSVFVGASRSKAQPTVVLLLRATRRELTLCEHSAKDAASVAPVFSPDSRRVYFQSDREGKSALYSVNVESLVEPT